MSFISRCFGPSKLLSQNEYDEVINRDYRRNASIFILFDVFWGIGMSFAMFQTVVPAYMVTIGCSKALIGLISSFWPYITPFQILISHYFRTRKRKVWLMGSYTLSVALWLIYSLFFLLFPESVGYNVQVTLFSFCMILFMVFCAGNQTVQFSLITDCTPLRKRGSLYGYRFVAQAVAVLLFSWIASKLMNYWEEPTNFLMAFVIGCTFYIICFSIVLVVREHRNPEHLLEIQDQSKSERLLPKISKRSITFMLFAFLFPALFVNSLIVFKSQLGMDGSLLIAALIAIIYSILLVMLAHKDLLLLWKMLKNKRFLVFTVFSFLFAASFAIGNFVIVFAKDQLGIEGSQVPIFTAIQMLSAAVFCMLLGKLADKIGYKTIYVFQSLLLCTGFLTVIYVAINPETSIFVTYLGYVLYTSGLGVQAMVLFNMLVELFPEENCGTVIALYNLIIMPLNMSIGPLAGWSVDKTGSYVPVFTVGAAMALISALGFLLFVREPRKYLKPKTEGSAIGD